MPKVRSLIGKHEVIFPQRRPRTWRLITTSSSSTTSSKTSSSSLQTGNNNSELENIHDEINSNNKNNKKNNDDDNNNNDDDDDYDYEHIRRLTRDWFDRIVVGWNLCPFADRPNREGNLEMFLVRGNNEEDILNLVLNVCQYQHLNPGTSLIIAPDYHPESFVDFLSLCTTMEDDILPQYPELQESIQIAPFHPLFEFADSDGVDVWTNRSPYPIIHILREQDVSKAVEKLQGDASKVWGRNIQLLRDLEVALGGPEELERVVRNANHDKEDIVRDVLKRNRSSDQVK